MVFLALIHWFCNWCLIFEFQTCQNLFLLFFYTLSVQVLSFFFNFCRIIHHKVVTGFLTHWVYKCLLLLFLIELKRINFGKISLQDFWRVPDKSWYFSDALYRVKVILLCRSAQLDKVSISSKYMIEHFL